MESQDARTSERTAAIKEFNKRRTKNRGGENQEKGVSTATHVAFGGRVLGVGAEGRHVRRPRAGHLQRRRWPQPRPAALRRPGRTGARRLHGRGTARNPPSRRIRQPAARRDARTDRAKSEGSSVREDGGDRCELRGGTEDFAARGFGVLDARRIFPLFLTETLDGFGWGYFRNRNFACPSLRVEEDPNG